MQAGDGQRLGLLAAVELVGLGQQHQKRQALLHARANDLQQRLVQLLDAVARIAKHDHRRQIGAREQVIDHDLLPAQLVGLRHGGIAIAGQIGQHGIGLAPAAQGEQIDVLGAPRRFGSEGQAVLLRQRIDGRGLARVGAAHEGDFRHLQRGQLVQLGGRGEKTRRVQPAKRKGAGGVKRVFLARVRGGKRHGAGIVEFAASVSGHSRPGAVFSITIKTIPT